jgi:macrolide transport system ATP-binding/permease protein
MAAVIEIRNLTKTYHLGDVDVHALNGVNLTIQHGEFVAVMGASGSGKSTLMNMLGCLDLPTSGNYLLGGEDVAQLDETELAAIRSRQIGFIFQSFNLLARTSARENVELPLFYSTRTDADRERASELLRLVGLTGREQNLPNQLSGGQQQRVAIARALVNQPLILLADEPTGNLDSTNSAEIMEFIRHLNRDQGITVIVVTHDPDVAAYADRVVTFKDGVILSDTRKPAAPALAAAAVAAPGNGAPAVRESGPVAIALRFGTMALGAAARALRRNKMRAVLTMLGIFIGVAAVIAMVAIGDGARFAVEQQIASLGTNLLVVLPGATTSNGVRIGYGSRSTLTVADAEAIRKCSGVALVSYMDRQNAQVINGNKNWGTSINGTTSSYLSVRDWPVAQGRGFTDTEERNAANVCLLGNTVALNLFGEDSDPIGATIRVKGFPLRVVGVLSIKGQSNFGQDQDDVVLLPFVTAERKVLGTSQVSFAVSSATTGSTNVVLNPYVSVPVTNANSAMYQSGTAIISPFGSPLKISGVVNVLFVKAKSGDLVDVAMDQVQKTLHERHRIPAGQDDDFTVRSLNEIAEASESATRVMTLLLAAVASISLLVGGIGIMNIMLVSVTERTREIGIRMAIGARRVQVMLQFLIEAVLLSVLGGVAGILLGVVTSKTISALAGWPTLISPVAIAGGFIFSAAVGVFFGYYPARKASMLNPIDALRYE